jgi:transposase-like protein
MKHRRRCLVVRVPSAFAGFRVPAEVIMLEVYLRCGLSYRDVEELFYETYPKISGRWRYL